MTFADVHRFHACAFTRIIELNMSASESDQESARSHNSCSVDEDGSEEDIGEQASSTEPYVNEPLADSDEPTEENLTDDEDGIPSASIAERFERTAVVDSW